MKKSALALLGMLITQSTLAGELVIMKFDGKDTFKPLKREKIIIISASNVNGTSLVNATTESTMCQVLVSSIAEGAAIVSAVTKNTTLECYTTEESKQAYGKNVVLTKEISIVKGMLNN
jgi:UDP-N-acetyl-D-mannosaminuronic acid transferase (WecB/TagA/CpsF family)